MKRTHFHLHTIFVTGLSLTMPLAAAAPAATWDGVWHLDYKASTDLGRPFTMTPTGEGAWHYDDHRTDAHDIHCAAQATPGTTCLLNGDHEIDLLGKTGAVDQRWALSNKGNTLTVAGWYDPNAYNPLETLPESFARVGGTSGFSGTWLSTRFVHVPSTIDLSTPLPGYLLMITACKDCEGPEHHFFKLSRTPVPYDGATPTLSDRTIQLVSPGKLRTVSLPRNHVDLPGRPITYTTLERHGETLVLNDRGSIAVYRKSP